MNRAELEIKIEKAKERLEKLQSQKSKISRGDTNKQKYLLGAFLLSKVPNSHAKEWNITLTNSDLDKYLTRPADRKVFGLAVPDAQESHVSELSRLIDVIEKDYWDWADEAFRENLDKAKKQLEGGQISQETETKYVEQLQTWIKTARAKKKAG